ncbi:MAG: bifunctional (p)ppGpp synthetase/guanosine-3',5'-bis(diphosphate) 3'-pyrophosphohydrolase [Chloroflexi bacterium]|nr:bifunctional (p)ppGpp synthetase/guanosine-3',5'-bis(diphosphate) 3'-pyrophosphohydrolase [Chloroflexota bacterium]
MEIEELRSLAAEYLPESELKTIERAYAVAAEAHARQTRATGDPYVSHSVAVACILAESKMDTATLVAGLLHDVPEDTGVTLEDIRREFGDEVAHLVDGLTKLKRIRRLSRASPKGQQAEQAENLRKLILASVDDVRVILIKLADRLHNMRTLSALPEDKQVRIARETLETFAPLANRLGIWQYKWQLEDLALRYLNPDEYFKIARLLAERREERDRYIQRVADILHKRLEEEGIRAEIMGRTKHIYSIYRKMMEKQRTFEQIYDVRGLRVIVDEVRDCYTVLGIVHALWRPIPGEFDDYIAMPKDNLYQSLHTAVIALEGKPLEIQIRTHQMHYLAEYGIAAHWRYKERLPRDAEFEAKIAWLRQVTDWRQDVSKAGEFVDSLKSDVLPERVYVFTPKGDIIDLPQGATPVDFAYHVHSEIGDRTRGAKVNGRLVPLDYQLKSGEQVEIITAKRGGPSRDWLNPNLGYIRTSRAREKVRQWFRRQERAESIAQGREILERELRRLGLEDRSFEEIARLFKYTKVDNFLAAIGYGDIHPQQLASKILSLVEEKPLVLPDEATLALKTAGVQVTGVGDLLTRLAQCCNPVPGDPIVGYITRGKGITIHRHDCPNVRSLSDSERLISVSWGPAREVYPVRVRIEAFDRSGLLRDIAAIVTEEGVNMSSANISTHSDNTATIVATLEIANIKQLSNILARIDGIRDVFEVRRETN